MKVLAGHDGSGSAQPAGAGGAAGRLVMGSVSVAVAREAPCSALVVP